LWTIIVLSLKYQDTSEMSPLENSTTELFVFVLKYLKYKKSQLLVKIMKLFDINIKTDFLNLYIKTQEIIYIEDEKVIPDIIVEYNGKKIIIEVKVDSPLNKKEYKNKEINQIEYYEKIKGIDKVFLLSKRILTVKKSENRILWSTIYEKLNVSDDFVIKSFTRHLEENGMSEVTITRENIDSISNAIPSLVALDSLLQDSWPEDVYKNYKVTPLKISKGKNWSAACSIKNKRKETLFWMGLIQEQDGTYLYVELKNKKIMKKLDEKQYKIMDDCFDGLNIADILKFKKSEGQKKVINNWYKKVMRKLVLHEA